MHVFAQRFPEFLGSGIVQTDDPKYILVVIKDAGNVIFRH